MQSTDWWNIIWSRKWAVWMPRRRPSFATTEEFLRRFGIGSTDHLPAMDPVRAEELRSQVEEELKVTMEETEQETGGES